MWWIPIAILILKAAELIFGNDGGPDGDNDMDANDGGE